MKIRSEMDGVSIVAIVKTGFVSKHEHNVHTSDSHPSAGLAQPRRSVSTTPATVPNAKSAAAFVAAFVAHDGL